MLNQIDVINKFRPYDGENFGNEVYIGSEARFITMPSGNNLTQSFFLGEPCSTNISERNSNALITEEYGNQENNKDYFTKETEIINGEIIKVIETFFINIYNSGSYLKEIYKIKETIIDGDNITEKIYSEEEYNERNGE